MFCRFPLFLFYFFGLWLAYNLIWEPRGSTNLSLFGPAVPMEIERIQTYVTSVSTVQPMKCRVYAGQILVQKESILAAIQLAPRRSLRASFYLF